MTPKEIDKKFGELQSAMIKVLNLFAHEVRELTGRSIHEMAFDQQLAVLRLITAACESTHPMIKVQDGYTATEKVPPVLLIEQGVLGGDYSYLFIDPDEIVMTQVPCSPCRRCDSQPMLYSLSGPNELHVVCCPCGRKTSRESSSTFAISLWDKGEVS